MSERINTLTGNSYTTDETSKKIVLILGMHRSGTSVTGRLLKHLGCYFGNNLINKIDKINADGFWEDKTVVSINDRILELVDSTWYSFQSLPLNWWQTPAMEECYAAASQWFHQDFNYQMPSAIKDPRFCRTLPFWLHFFNQKKIQPNIVLIYRHPYSVAASLNKRDGFTFEVSYLLWLTYTLDALEQAPIDTLALLCYENLLKNPVETTKSLLYGGLKDVPSLKRLRFVRVANKIIDPQKNNNPPIENTHGNEMATYKNMAHELYKDLKDSTAENIALIVNSYRKKLSAAMESEKQILAVLQEELNYHVSANRQLTTLGAEHTVALTTISKKDAIYERSLLNAEKRISGNKAYIEKCHSRIREQDDLLKMLGKKAELVENLQLALTDRELKLTQNIAYIKKCESRILEQDEIILQLKSATFIWPILHAAKRVIKSWLT